MGLVAQPCDPLAVVGGGAVLVVADDVGDADPVAAAQPAREPQRGGELAAVAHDLAVADDADGRDLLRLLEGTTLRVHASDDFPTLLWRKLLINAIANPVTALTLQRQAVFRRADIQRLCREILEEAAMVGRAEGAWLAPDEPDRIIEQLLTYPPEAGTSMYFDRVAGRSLEVEALTGAIVEAGARHGIATPLNRAFAALLRAVSDAAESQ